jgi:hypothetical protein
MSTFETKLTEMFAAVEPKFRAGRVAHYHMVATANYDGWVKALNGPEPAPFLVREFCSTPRFVISPVNYLRNWADTKASVGRGEYKVDLETAEREANLEVDGAKHHFLTKIPAKLTNATKRRKGKPELKGQLSYEGGIITGVLNARWSNGDGFIIDMTIKQNYRNGQSYYQFPAIFKNVILNGQEPIGRMSEGWLADNFK